ncbi:MAG: cytochrome c maturation protein CcmE [Bacteroidetes bacterium]|nr:cytochrome c maturation protein CcmE [Bacteroidota bacterium]
MNKGAIVGLSIVVIAVVLLLLALDGAGTYSTFREAEQNPDKVITIIGTLNKSKPVVYDPVKNTDLTTMFVSDKENVEREVYFHGAKPRDIEKSENITLTGKMVNEIFHAETILVKCPSKYENGKLNPATLEDQQFGTGR